MKCKRYDVALNKYVKSWFKHVKIRYNIVYRNNIGRKGQGQAERDGEDGGEKRDGEEKTWMPIYQTLHAWTRLCMTIQDFAWLYKTLHVYTRLCMPYKTLHAYNIRLCMYANIFACTSAYLYAYLYPEMYHISILTSSVHDVLYLLSNFRFLFFEMYRGKICWTIC